MGAIKMRQKPTEEWVCWHCKKNIDGQRRLTVDEYSVCGECYRKANGVGKEGQVNESRQAYGLLNYSGNFHRTSFFFGRILYLARQKNME